MNIKLLALDLDDTLLDENSDFRCKPCCNPKGSQRRNTCYFGHWQDVLLGTALCPAASDEPAADYLPRRLNSHGGQQGDIASYSGPPGPGQEAAAIAEEKGLHINVYINDRLYVAEENEFSRYYQSIAGVDVETVGRISTFEGISDKNYYH